MLAIFLEVLQNAEDFEITCEDTAKQALSYTLQARKIKNQIEESRKNIVRPHLDFQKAVMKFAKDIQEKFDSIENVLHKKISSWMKTQRENPFTRVDEIIVEDGSISYKTKYDCEIIDETLIPREYLKIDEEAIKKSVNAGVRKIPGVKIFNHETTTLRVKN